MARFEQHCRDCVEALGEDFAEVHRWLDELQPEYGPRHRAFRHHRDGVELIRQRWGDRAAAAAEIHIRRDTGGGVPTPWELRHHYGIRIEDLEPEDD